MEIFAKARERFPIIKFLVNAQKTAWYPILFGVLCAIGALNNYKVYIPILWILVTMHLFSVLFTDDNKVFLTPLGMMYFALGRDASANSFYESSGDMMAYMHPDALKHIIAIGVIGVGALAARLILDGSVSSALKKHKCFTWSIFALDAAFLLNGLFSPSYDISNLAFGALLAMGFTVIYFLVAGMTERSRGVTKYACTVMLCTSCSALVQIMTVAYKLHLKDQLILKLYGYNCINKTALSLGWGVSSVVAALLIIGIPAALYLAKNEKFCVLTYFTAPLLVLGTLIINARGPLLVGAGLFVVLSIICCFKGKNRIAIRICFGVCVLAAIAVAVYIFGFVTSIDTLIELFRFQPDNDNGRFDLWENGISDFLRAPVFGAGFADGGFSASEEYGNFYSNMYHCILVQFPGAMGIVGCIAFIFHLVQLGIMIFKGFSFDRFILLCIPLALIAMSLFDNFFFYLQFQIFYGIFSAVAERSFNQS